MRACDYKGCDEEATVRCRFGDGTFTISAQRLNPGPVTHYSGKVQRQAFAYYCDPCFQAVDRLFVLCDVDLADAPTGSGRPKAVV